MIPRPDVRELRRRYTAERGKTRMSFFERIKSEEEKFYPAPSEYKIFYGELHGHCGLSDGKDTSQGKTLTMCPFLSKVICSFRLLL